MADAIFVAGMLLMTCVCSIIACALLWTRLPRASGDGVSKPSANVDRVGAARFLRNLPAAVGGLKHGIYAKRVVRLSDARHPLTGG